MPLGAHHCREEREHLRRVGAVQRQARELVAEHAEELGALGGGVVPEAAERRARLVARRRRPRLQHEREHKRTRRHRREQRLELDRRVGLRRCRTERSAAGDDAASQRRCSLGARRRRSAAVTVAALAPRRIGGDARRAEAGGDDPHGGGERLVVELERGAAEEGERTVALADEQRWRCQLRGDAAASRSFCGEPQSLSCCSCVSAACRLSAAKLAAGAPPARGR